MTEKPIPESIYRPRLTQRDVWMKSIAKVFVPDYVDAGPASLESAPDEPEGVLRLDLEGNSAEIYTYAGFVRCSWKRRETSYRLTVVDNADRDFGLHFYADTKVIFCAGITKIEIYKLSPEPIVVFTREKFGIKSYDFQMALTQSGLFVVNYH